MLALVDKHWWDIWRCRHVWGAQHMLARLWGGIPYKCDRCVDIEACSRRHGSLVIEYHPALISLNLVHEIRRSRVLVAYPELCAQRTTKEDLIASA